MKKAIMFLLATGLSLGGVAMASGDAHPSEQECTNDGADAKPTQFWDDGPGSPGIPTWPFPSDECDFVYIPPPYYVYNYNGLCTLVEFYCDNGDLQTVKTYPVECP